MDFTCVCPTSQAPQLPSCSFPFELITEIKAKTQPGRFANSSSLFLQAALVSTPAQKHTSYQTCGIHAGNSQEGLSANPDVSIHQLRDAASPRATGYRSLKGETKGGSEGGKKMPGAAGEETDVCDASQHRAWISLSPVSTRSLQSQAERPAWAERSPTLSPSQPCVLVLSLATLRPQAVDAGWSCTRAD